MNTKVKLVILSFEDPNWTGGLSYMKNLEYSLGKYARHIDFKLVHIPKPKEYNSKLINLVRLLFDRNLKAWVRKSVGYDYFLYREIKNKSFDHFSAVFTIGSLSIKKKKSVLSWIPDFQHLHLKEFFSSEEIKWRNTDTIKAAETSNFIILSSESSFSDFVELCPQQENKARMLKFSVKIPDSVLLSDSKDVISKYDLPEKYFYMPGQLWRHRNHEIVLKAIDVLKHNGIEVFVVFTGFTTENQNSYIYENLVRKIKDMHLEQNVAMLGMVPYEDVIKLLRHSLSLLNPSLFEGWSTTVEEAKALGKLTLLSNIEAHIEQKPPGAHYFDTKSFTSLADKMGEVWLDYPADFKVMPESESLAIAEKGLKEYALKFQKYLVESLTQNDGK